jgi:putative ABC transport system permease protein
MDPNAPYKIELGLQPYRDQYLVAQFVNGKPQGGRFEYIPHLYLCGTFHSNYSLYQFYDLATARSIKRAKEVGVRKVVGSSRAGLIGQFFVSRSYWHY